MGEHQLINHVTGAPGNLDSGFAAGGCPQRVMAPLGPRPRVVPVHILAGLALPVPQVGFPQPGVQVHRQPA